MSVAELYQLRNSGGSPVIVDVRPAYTQREGRIPGAMAVSLENIHVLTVDTPADSEVIVYCACPMKRPRHGWHGSSRKKAILERVLYTVALTLGLRRDIRWNPDADNSLSFPGVLIIIEDLD